MLVKFDSGTSKGLYEVATGDEIWIYQFGLQTKRQSSIWLFEKEENMVATFSPKEAILSQYLWKNKNNSCCKLVYRGRKATKDRYKRHSQDDNASAYFASKTKDFLITNKIQLVGQPYYSTKLAPCDFCFPKSRKNFVAQNLHVLMSR